MRPYGGVLPLCHARRLYRQRRHLIAPLRTACDGGCSPGTSSGRYVSGYWRQYRLFLYAASSIVGQSGKVITFEPNPQNLQLIYESQLRNGFVNQAIYPYAVSDQPGILRFTTVGSNGGVVTETSQDQNHYLLVQAAVIDDVLPDQPITMVKIDIEAHEPFALRGMTKLLKKYRPKIVMEFHPWAMEGNNVDPPEEYLKQLEDFGYRLGVIEAAGVQTMGRREILAHWKSLQQATIQIDLFCEPI